MNDANILLSSPNSIVASASCAILGIGSEADVQDMKAQLADSATVSNTITDGSIPFSRSQALLRNAGATEYDADCIVADWLVKT